jgi:hypothetical protein
MSATALRASSWLVPAGNSKTSLLSNGFRNRTVTGLATGTGAIGASGTGAGGATDAATIAVDDAERACHETAPSIASTAAAAAANTIGEMPCERAFCDAAGSGARDTSDRVRRRRSSALNSMSIASTSQSVDRGGRRPRGGVHRFRDTRAVVAGPPDITSTPHVQTRRDDQRIREIDEERASPSRRRDCGPLHRQALRRSLRGVPARWQRLKAGCAMPSTAAAFDRLPLSATARKYWSCLSSMCCRGDLCHCRMATGVAERRLVVAPLVML